MRISFIRVGGLLVATLQQLFKYIFAMKRALASTQTRARTTADTASGLPSPSYTRARVPDTTPTTCAAVAAPCQPAGPPISKIPSRPSTFAVHHAYTTAIADYVKNLRVRDKRNIYIAMRLKPDVKTDSFLPHFGLSVADFCVWQTLNEKPRQTTT